MVNNQLVTMKQPLWLLNENAHGWQSLPVRQTIDELVVSSSSLKLTQCFESVF